MTPDPDLEEEWRVVECQSCDGLGFVVTGTWSWPGTWYDPPEGGDIEEDCDTCGGSGWALAQVEPIGMDDLPQVMPEMDEAAEERLSE